MFRVANIAPAVEKVSLLPWKPSVSLNTSSKLEMSPVREESIRDMEMSFEVSLSMPSIDDGGNFSNPGLNTAKIK